MNSDQQYEAIMQVRRASGMNNKKAKLSAFPELKNMLRTTYSPYIQFGITPTEAWITDCGEEYFSQKTSLILECLADGTFSGNRARTEVKRHLKELTYNSGRLLIMIINKSFDFGLAAKSINDVFPGLVPVHAIQLAKKFEISKCRFPCHISPKLDGLRSVYKNGEFYSRQGHIFVGLSSLKLEMEDLMRQLAMPCQFDGELMVDGEHFNEISGQIRAFTEADNAHYYIFDIHSVNANQTSRLAFLDMLAMRFRYPHITFVPHTTVMSLDEVSTKYAEYLAEGYEGAIVKQESGMYQDSRTWDWMKLKNTMTEDCRVTSLFEGTGKYVGMAGGIVVDFNGVSVRVGSGLSDSQRMYWWNDPDEIIGRTAEIAFQEVTPDKSMRHPRLIKLRGDK